MYAGSGIPFLEGDKINLNLLISKGAKGHTEDLIEPIEEISFKSQTNRLLRKQTLNFIIQILFCTNKPN